jgi:hypothetical protein
MTLWALVGAVLATGVQAGAGEVKVSFSNGRVTVIADNASPREILGEWAKLGKVRVANLDKLAGGPVTLQMNDVSETQALETLLRGTAGYVAAPRRDRVATLSLYDRILLMPGLAPAAPVAGPTIRPGVSTPINRGRQGQSLYGMPASYQTGPRLNTDVQQPPAAATTSSPAPGQAATGSAARPGEMTAPAPATVPSPYGLTRPAAAPVVQPPIKTPAGPIKVPE